MRGSTRLKSGWGARGPEERAVTRPPQDLWAGCATPGEVRNWVPGSAKDCLEGPGKCGDQPLATQGV